MAVHRRHLKVVSPCPVELDPERGKRGERTWYCGHCEKNVHVLSNMTEAEARTLLRGNEGKDLCVSYAVNRDGSVKFKPAAALALAAALAACAPHDNDSVERPCVSAQDRGVAPTPDPPTIPDRVDPQPDPDIAFDGAVALEEPPEVVEGGLRAEPIPQELPKPGGIRVEPLPE